MRPDIAIERDTDGRPARLVIGMSHYGVVEATCRSYQIAAPVAEYRFAAPRRWRFDFAWPERKVALEVEGGAWIAGRHTRGAGFEKDLEKYNTAAARGWRVLRVTPRQLKLTQTYDWLREALSA